MNRLLNKKVAFIDKKWLIFENEDMIPKKFKDDVYTVYDIHLDSLTLMTKSKLLIGVLKIDCKIIKDIKNNDDNE